MAKNDSEYKYFMAPIRAYVWRTLPQSFLGLCLGYLIPTWLFFDVEEAWSIWESSIVLVAVLLGYAMPWALIVRKRPYIKATKEGISVIVDRFFSNKLAVVLYSQRGYGDEYLPMIIDYATPFSIEWNEIKYFKVEKRYLLYRLRLITYNRQGEFLYSSYSRQQVKLAKKNFERLRAEYLQNTDTKLSEK